MIALFNEILVRPFFNLLIFIYNVVPGADFGVAVVLLTVAIRLVLMPLSVKTLRSQKNIAKLQPKLKELQVKYKNDKQALAREQMALYKEHGVNPLSGCLPLLIQLPILLALYQTFINGFKPESLNLLYSFVENPGTIKSIAFGFFDITHKSPVVAVLAGVLQFIQAKKANLAANMGAGGQGDMAAAMNKQMLYFFPFLITIIAWNLPFGLTLYWVVTTVYSIFEQLYINKKYK